eukprot:6989304-Pyramimonas_sp.AAC.2
MKAFGNGRLSMIIGERQARCYTLISSSGPPLESSIFPPCIARPSGERDTRYSARMFHPY